MDILNTHTLSSDIFSRLKKHFFLKRTEPADYQYLSDRLHSTLDINQVLAFYINEVQYRLPITGVRFLHPEVTLNTSNFVDDEKTLSLPLDSQHSSVAQLSYSCSQSLTASQTATLLALQKKLYQPILNSVKVYKLEKNNRTDYLTGLGNRAFFDEQLTRMIEQSRRHQSSFAVMLFDLDNFKFANDQYGHAVGDQVLKNFAEILGHATRKTDFLFRFGGDEFAILIDQENLKTTEIIAQRIHSYIRQSERLKAANISVSIGCAKWQQDTSEEIFRRVDNALYAAKFAGKNQIKVA
ncbi:GGDEF domain-containing protein [Gayadomonas joobiniege]|uniref:GGDEF domain-containing protein n=1 Tax=Gayadomonas joobiniege TaxID=1234606 RepID=UPI00035D6AE1|nr:GGDEF domain-containing protein [Gayadomonas joobiniege]